MKGKELAHYLDISFPLCSLLPRSRVELKPAPRAAPCPREPFVYQLAVEVDDIDVEFIGGRPRVQRSVSWGRSGSRQSLGSRDWSALLDVLSSDRRRSFTNLPQSTGCLRKFPPSRLLLQIPRTRALRNRQPESGVLRLDLFDTRDPDPAEDVERQRRNDDGVMSRQPTLEVCGFVPGADDMTTVITVLESVPVPTDGVVV